MRKDVALACGGLVVGFVAGSWMQYKIDKKTVTSVNTLVGLFDELNDWASKNADKTSPHEFFSSFKRRADFIRLTAKAMEKDLKKKV